MFERLNRLRAERDKAQAKFEDAKAKLDEANDKLRAEEATNILDIVDSVKFTPEQLAEYLGIKVEKAPSSKNKKEKAKEENVVLTEDILDESF